MTDLPEPAGDFGWTAGLGPVRESFEAWASAQGWAPSDLSDKCMPGSPRGGEYRHRGAQEMWETWEAATGIARQKWRRDVSRALALLEASEDRAAQVALTALLSGPNI